MFVRTVASWLAKPDSRSETGWPAGHEPRFAATVAFGAQHQPWITAVTAK